MNIKEYYAGMSRLYLHQSILCTVIFSILILPAFKITQYIVIIGAGIFILILMIYYTSRFFYFSFKSKALPNPNEYKSTNKFIMIDAPIFSYNWKLYTEDGYCRYSGLKIKGKDKRVYLKTVHAKKANVLRVIDHHENREWNTLVNNEGVTIFTENYRFAFKAIRIDKREYIANNGLDQYHVKKLATTCVISKNGNKIMVISTGLMPLSMQKLFYSSTPIVRFSHDIEDYERLFCLGLFFK